MGRPLDIRIDPRKIQAAIERATGGANEGRALIAEAATRLDALGDHDLAKRLAAQFGLTWQSDEPR